ncbi:response regulator [Idiomarina sp. A28L]|uniref:response regulator transcription factor n=1 Tax=Idiomarina sp. A28L TaxID=1036674 RepID=UPI00021389A8|nr:response regulator transcription factor [Idiomarina sp. A28L]EGN74974.1 response regulator [Idiomarina sp. A28L]
MTQIISLVIADDHTLMRQGVVKMLDVYEDITVLAECDNGIDLTKAVIVYQPDVILMDIAMPKMNGLVAIEKILLQRPDSKVLVLTMHNELEYMEAFYHSGAVGYVLKDATGDELYEVIRKVYGGVRVFPPLLEEAIKQGNVRPSLENLTRREREVFHLVVQGHPTKEIGRLLNMATKTAEHHRGKVLQKFNVTTTAELIHIAVKKNIYH